MSEIRWAKAARCPNNATCVEVGEHGGLVLIRDSKDPDGPVLTFDRDEWATFRAGMRGMDFDHIGGEQA